MLGNACTTCGHRNERLDGFEICAPESARTGTGYDPRLYPELATLEDRNFWFRARNRLIVRALHVYCDGFDSLLEIGCGTGQVLHAIKAAFPTASLSGSELFVEGLPFARMRVPDARLMQMDATAIPFDREFDVIGAFDVIEHVPDDRKVIAEMCKALKPGGHAVISVPQHPWLWSRQDVMARHVRRYRRHELERKLEDAGFKVMYTTSFVTLLLPVMAASRIGGTGASDDPLREVRIGRILNALFAGVMHAEDLLMHLGLRFPFGGSRLVVATKAD